MKQKLTAAKWFVAGLLVMTVLTGTFVMASPEMREIFFGVQVEVDGSLVNFAHDMQPFIMNDRTYLPVRAIAEALGVDVDFVDGTVILTSAAPAVAPPPVAPPPVQENIIEGHGWMANVCGPDCEGCADCAGDAHGDDCDCDCCTGAAHAPDCDCDCCSDDARDCGCSDDAPATAAVNAITSAEISALKAAWGNGLVAISTAYDEDEEYGPIAQGVLDDLYAYASSGLVLFKPTVTEVPYTFRFTEAGAAEYFIGTDRDQDGFALGSWREVEFDTNGRYFINGETAMWMGNVHITNADGDTVTVDKTFGLYRCDDGDVRIVLHHSSLPHVS